jgi:hypothetical protein
VLIFFLLKKKHTIQYKTLIIFLFVPVQAGAFFYVLCGTILITPTNAGWGHVRISLGQGMGYILIYWIT